MLPLYDAPCHEARSAAGYITPRERCNAQNIPLFSTGLGRRAIPLGDSFQWTEDSNLTPKGGTAARSALSLVIVAVEETLGFMLSVEL